MSFRRLSITLMMIKTPILVSVIFMVYGYTMTIMNQYLIDNELYATMLKNFQNLFTLGVIVSSFAAYYHLVIPNIKKYIYTLPISRKYLIILPLISVLIVPVIFDVAYTLPFYNDHREFLVNTNALQYVFIKYFIIIFLYIIAYLCDNLIDLLIWHIVVFVSHFMFTQGTGKNVIYIKTMNLLLDIHVISTLILLGVFMLIAFILVFIMYRLKVKSHHIDVLYFMSKLAAIIAIFSLVIDVLVVKYPNDPGFWSVRILDYSFVILPWVVFIIGILIYLRIVSNNITIKKVIVSFIVLILFVASYIAILELGIARYEMDKLDRLDQEISVFSPNHSTFSINQDNYQLYSDLYDFLNKNGKVVEFDNNTSNYNGFMLGEYVTKDDEMIYKMQNTLFLVKLNDKVKAELNKILFEKPKYVNVEVTIPNQEPYALLTNDMDKSALEKIGIIKSYLVDSGALKEQAMAYCKNALYRSSTREDNSQVDYHYLCAISYVPKDFAYVTDQFGTSADQSVFNLTNKAKSPNKDKKKDDKKKSSKK
jgi:hypothetical protein